MNNIIIENIELENVLRNCAEILLAAYNSDNWTKGKAQEKLECFYNSTKFIGIMVFAKDKPVGCCVGNIEPYYIFNCFYLKEMLVSPEFQHIRNRS